MKKIDKFSLPDDMPPIPQSGEYGPQVCAAVRLYLAILDDLAPEQVDLIFEHVQKCVACGEEMRVVKDSTRLIASLDETSPSPGTERAILALAQSNPAQAGSRWGSSSTPLGRRERRSIEALDGSRRGVSVKWIGTLVAAVIVVLALLPLAQNLGIFSAGNTAFALPDKLSWNGYVLFHSETRVGASGVQYRVNTYHDLGVDRMNVETTMGASLDVIAVVEGSKMLCKDMVHGVAEWGAYEWSIDDSAFDLSKLRSDIQAKRAVYLGKSSFGGQDVYRIRLSNGHVLLLNMSYMPVNMLQSASGNGANVAMYDPFKLLPASKVAQSTWDMSVPPGFRMGAMPAKP